MIMCKTVFASGLKITLDRVRELKSFTLINSTFTGDPAQVRHGEIFNM